MYHRVYAPDGTPFDVTRDRADQLVLQHGWTQTPSVDAPEPVDEDVPAFVEEPEAEPAPEPELPRQRFSVPRKKK